MTRTAPQYTFDDRGLPTLKKAWDFNLPEIPTFPETPSGRRARGELEIMVDWICKRHVIDTGTGATCEVIAKEVTDLDGRPTAKQSVRDILHSWTEMEYAITGDNPNRFIAFTAKGMELGLDELHRRRKRAQRREKESRARGTIKPRRRK